MAGRRLLFAAHKLPAAFTDNTRINQLKTPGQIYDLSFTAHFQLLTLHPFGVGNGRLAWLLMSYIQHYYQLPFSLVYVDNQRLTGLESCWRQKTTGAHRQFYAVSVAPVVTGRYGPAALQVRIR